MAECPSAHSRANPAIKLGFHEEPAWCSLAADVRIGLIDICAAAVVLVVIVLPTPRRPVKPDYESKTPEVVAERIAGAQAALLRHPTNGEAAETLAHELQAVRQTDWALRVAGAVGSDPQAKMRWKALLATSAVHVDRLEIGPAHEWAEKAYTACTEDRETCLEHDRVRLEIYAEALKAGKESGIDPREDPRGFDSAVRRATPMIHLERGKLPGGEIPDEPKKAPAPAPTPGPTPASAPAPAPETK